MMIQKGMNFRLHPTYSVLLMSVRKGAPYNDRWHEDLGLLEYEGHDESRRKNRSVNVKSIDQPMKTPKGNLTENGKFYQAVMAYKEGKQEPEIVQVYEKISQGVWCDQGRFELIDAKIVYDGRRNVFRFFLRPCAGPKETEPFLKETRTIPTPVKVQVWKRDKGRCVLCGATTNLHFDHDIPYSKGGSSITADNVRILCAKHNLEKSNKIMSLGPLLGLSSLLILKSV
ncbi:MAG TPA: hypothetical protein PK054_00200 [Anaerohalosphaeraceae bacterium]|nr:hypothetical protein [Anaerohalosphaeraceae bacterium]HOL89669.1 hypothetical protein [Anaerohalosphaeraceae bacterium]HPP54983.1 hypothetical protein [Anaerohalosphaeraceae bacterium]